MDLAISSLSGCTSQPNLNSIVHALRNAPRSTGLDVDALNQLSIYWEAVRQYYSPFDTSPLSEVPRFTNTKCQVGNTQTFVNKRVH